MNMTNVIQVSVKDVIQQVKLSRQIPLIVESIIAQKIILKTSQELGMQVEDDDLQKAADHFRLIHNLQGANETWSWLKRHGLSIDEFEALIYTQVVADKLAQKLFADKIEPFFFAHQIDYTGAFLCEVIFDNQDLAIEFFYAIQEGETSFHEVAYGHIKDAELRRTAGYKGLVLRKDMRPEISASVFSATPPQMLHPITTSQGVHLILVQEFVHPKLDDAWRAKILSDFFSEWLKKQATDMQIVLDISNPVVQTAQ
jgi:parvulin-like peptidyl-prolyl isomerase